MPEVGRQPGLPVSAITFAAKLRGAEPNAKEIRKVQGAASLGGAATLSTE